MKKIDFSWDAVSGADGYHLYFADWSNPFSYDSSKPAFATTHTFHNRADDEVVNIGVQPFQLRTVNGFERRVNGPVTAVQVDCSNGSLQCFDGTSLTSVVVSDE